MQNAPLEGPSSERTAACGAERRRQRRRHRGDVMVDAHFYSINSSARASSVGGTVRPSALAVLRLIVS